MTRLTLYSALTVPLMMSCGASDLTINHLPPVEQALQVASSLLGVPRSRWRVFESPTGENYGQPGRAIALYIVLGDDLELCRNTVRAIATLFPNGEIIGPIGKAFDTEFLALNWCQEFQA